jgi:DNA-binding MarR family transcriptional regulator
MVAFPLASLLVPTQPGDLYDVLADFLTRLHCAGESGGLDALAQSDLSFSQARALFVLTGTADPMPIHSIAEALGLSVAAAGRNVDQLLRLGLVERHESATDRRVKLVSLTSSGAELVAQHLEAKRDSLRAFTDALPPEHRTQLHRALSDILAGGVLRPLRDQENHL